MIQLINTVRIIRLEENYTFGTFGSLLINSQLYCTTLEPRDELNASFISSIPEQQYTCKKVISPIFGETFQIMNVPERDKVLFHPGNTVDQTFGCVILGEYPGKLKDERAVLNSGYTFRRFMNIFTKVNEFHLTICKYY